MGGFPVFNDIKDKFRTFTIFARQQLTRHGKSLSLSSAWINSLRPPRLRRRRGWVGRYKRRGRLRERLRFFYFLPVRRTTARARDNGSICGRDEHPAGLGSPCGLGDRRFEVGGEIQDLGSCHEIRFIGGKFGGKVITELRGIEISESVWRGFDGVRFAQLAGETLAILDFTLAGVRHMRRDITSPATDGSLPASVTTTPP